MTIRTLRRDLPSDFRAGSGEKLVPERPLAVHSLYEIRDGVPAPIDNASLQFRRDRSLVVLMDVDADAGNPFFGGAIHFPSGAVCAPCCLAQQSDESVTPFDLLPTPCFPFGIVRLPDRHIRETKGHVPVFRLAHEKVAITNIFLRKADEYAHCHWWGRSFHRTSYAQVRKALHSSRPAEHPPPISRGQRISSYNRTVRSKIEAEFTKP